MTSAEIDIIQDAINRISQGCDIESSVDGIDAALHRHINHQIARVQQVITLAAAQNGCPAARFDDDTPSHDWRGALTL